jgi:hypothetical protein
VLSWVSRMRLDRRQGLVADITSQIELSGLRLLPMQKAALQSRFLVLWFRTSSNWRGDRDDLRTPRRPWTAFWRRCWSPLVERRGEGLLR